MTRALIVLALVSWLAAAPAARAADTAASDPMRDIDDRALNDAERWAVDIVRVTATGGRFGVIVDAVFRGDLDATLGKGGLRNARVALVLHRRAGAPVVVATRGPDAAERTTRRAGVIRRGQTFQFFALGVTRVRRIEVRLTIGGRMIDSATVRRPSSSDGRACAALARRIDDLRDERAAFDGSLDAKRIDAARRRVIAAWRDLDCRPEVLVFSSGYEHHRGETTMCVDAGLVPDLGEAVAFEFYRFDEKVGEGASTLQPDGTQRLQATVTTEGRYRFVIFKRDDREIASRIELDVVAPPPVVTKDCAA